MQLEDDHPPDSPSADRGRDAIWPPLPAGRLDCYVSLWQLELWLRELVYLELKSRYGTDWAKYLVGLRPGPQRADSRLTHMPTRERGPLSYITFDSLLKTISKHGRLFAPYLPVRSVWDDGAFFPRLTVKSGETAPRACGWCRVREACLRGDSSSHRRLADWAKASEEHQERLSPPEAAIHGLWWMDAQKGR